MNKPVIAVDIDEVLSPLHLPFLKHHNETYGTKLKYPDPQGRYYMHQLSGETHEVNIARLEKFVNSKAFADIRPIDGAVQAIKKLEEKYELVILTARQLFYLDVTHIWLSRHFPNVFRDVHFVGLQRNSQDMHMPKAKFCKKIGACYLIDDAFKTVVECPAEGIEGLLFGSYHWNQAGDLPKGVTRVRNWQEVLEYFDARSSARSGQ